MTSPLTSPLFALATLAASSWGALATAGLVALVPLGAAYWLLTRAARSRPARPSTGSVDSLAAIRAELLQGYEELRRAGEAVPLPTAAWQRAATRAVRIPPATREHLVRSYQAIGVANRLLSAAAVYDVCGRVSQKGRRVSLWPTLEAAVRNGLAALGVEVTPARRVAVRPLAVPAAASVALGHAAARSSAPPPTFTLADAPRLTLFYGPEQGTAAAGSTAARPARPRARRTARPRNQKGTRRAARGLTPTCDGQMRLWGSVA